MGGVAGGRELARAGRPVPGALTLVPFAHTRPRIQMVFHASKIKRWRFVMRCQTAGQPGLEAAAMDPAAAARAIEGVLFALGGGGAEVYDRLLIYRWPSLCPRGSLLAASQGAPEYVMLNGNRGLGGAGAPNSKTLL